LEKKSIKSHVLEGRKGATSPDQLDHAVRQQLEEENNMLKLKVHNIFGMFYEKNIYLKT
jgi:hypothetical protein